jgi:hypothetical protein
MYDHNCISYWHYMNMQVSLRWQQQSELQQAWWWWSDSTWLRVTGADIIVGKTAPLTLASGSIAAANRYIYMIELLALCSAVYIIQWLLKRPYMQYTHLLGSSMLSRHTFQLSYTSYLRILYWVTTHCRDYQNTSYHASVLYCSVYGALCCVRCIIACTAGLLRKTYQLYESSREWYYWLGMYTML